MIAPTPRGIGLVSRFEAAIPREQMLLQLDDVLIGSPAQRSGLVAREDCILGSKSQSFSSVADFGKHITKYENQQLPVFVYNLRCDTVRVAIIVPNAFWRDRHGQGDEVVELAREAASIPPALLGCRVRLSAISEVIPREHALTLGTALTLEEPDLKAFDGMSPFSGRYAVTPRFGAEDRAASRTGSPAGSSPRWVSPIRESLVADA